jgi:hypothetical protein
LDVKRGLIANERPECVVEQIVFADIIRSDVDGMHVHSNIAKCVVCRQIMTSWDSTKIPIYKLVQRPEE